jgi:6-pyruvoyltetrahydropterin/6-carboxytetrahydropterin synthase
VVQGQKTYLLAGNPTAENLADHLLRVVGPDILAGTGVRLVKVTLHETENGIAEATL